MRSLPPDPFERRPPPRSKAPAAPAGPVSRLWRRARRWTVINLLILALAWIILAIPFFFLRKPAITRNYAAELSAPILALPRESIAWPDYDQFRQAFKPLDSGETRDLLEATPGDEAWPRTVALLDANPELITFLHRAAAKPGLGVVINGQRLDAHDPTTLAPSAPAPTLLASSGDHTPTLRTAARLLACDAALAAQRGRADRAVESLLAISAVSIHAREIPLLINQLIALATLELEMQTIRATLTLHPDLFDAAQLARLHDSLFRLSPPGRIAIDLSAESMGVDDMAQRIFGETYMGYQGIRTLEAINGPAPVHPALIVFGPFNSCLLLPTRQEFLAEGRSVYDAAAHDAGLNDWERTSPRLAAFTQSLSRPGPAMARPLVALIAPALERFIEAQSLISANREATAALLQVFIHRARDGRFPESLADLSPPGQPRDRFTGETLHYRLTEAGPVLYSGGVDRDDDGGRPPAHGDPLAAARLRASDEGTDGDWIFYPALIRRGPGIGKPMTERPPGPPEPN